MNIGPKYLWSVSSISNHQYQSWNSHVCWFKHINKVISFKNKVTTFNLKKWLTTNCISVTLHQKVPVNIYLSKTQQLLWCSGRRPIIHPRGGNPADKPAHLHTSRWKLNLCSWCNKVVWTLLHTLSSWTSLWLFCVSPTCHTDNLNQCFVGHKAPVLGSSVVVYLVSPGQNKVWQHDT